MPVLIDDGHAFDVTVPVLVVVGGAHVWDTFRATGCSAR